MNKKSDWNQRNDILDSIFKCLMISATLFAIIVTAMVAYVEFIAQPYEEYTPVIHMYDDSYKTPDFLEFVEQTKNGTWNDLEPRVVEETEKVEDTEEVESKDAVEEVEATKETAKTVSELKKQVVTNERELLAQLIYAEVGVLLYGNESADRKKLAFMLTGSAILNRAKEGHLGAHTVNQVLHSRGQYDSRTIAKVDGGGQEVPKIVYQWTDELLVNGTVGPKGLIYQAEFPQGITFAQIGNQYFGIEPNYAN